MFLLSILLRVARNAAKSALSSEPGNTIEGAHDVRKKSCYKSRSLAGLAHPASHFQTTPVEAREIPEQKKRRGKLSQAAVGGFLDGK